MSTPTRLAFETDDGFGVTARLGLVVLETDQTVEIELRSVLSPGVALYHSRIPMDTEVTVKTLTAMEHALPAAAGLLPSAWKFDVIGYACTSAATVIGEEGVAAALNHAHPGVLTTNPITAAVAAFRSLGIERLAVVTPYTAAVTAPVVELFRTAGLDVTAVGSFLESKDFTVARISEASVAAGVRAMATNHCEAVFVSCTSLRAFGVIDQLEAELGLPVVSSNAALGWHMLRLAGVGQSIKGPGVLYRTPLALTAMGHSRAVSL